MTIRGMTISEILDYIENLADSVETIPTSSVENVEMAIKVGILNPEPVIIVVTAAAGVGKSRCNRTLIVRDPSQTHTGLRKWEGVIVPNHPTRLSLIQEIFRQLGEEPGSKNAATLLRDLIEFLSDNQIRLLSFDEGDRLTRDSFETLKDLYEAKIQGKLKCHFIIFGLPEIWTLINSHKQFSSRAAYGVEMKPLETEELINKFLPELSIPKWKFDPKNPVDYALAQLLWKHTFPALRLLVVWIGTASALATLAEEDQITLDHLEQAYNFLHTNPVSGQRITAESVQGVHERISVLKNAYKAYKTGRRKK